MTGGAHQQRRSDAVEAILASDPDLLSIYRGLEGQQRCQLNFCSLRDVKAVVSIEQSITRQLGEYASTGQIRRAGVFYRYDPGCDTRASSVCLDLKRAWKGAASIKKAVPCSISRLVPFSGGSGIEGEAYTFGVAVATLALELDGQPLPSIGSSPLGSRSQSQPLGPRPQLEPCWIDQPDERAVAELVSRFMRTPQTFRAECAALARDLRMLPFKKHRAQRALGTFQLEALLPVHKAFMGVGLGDTILRVALTAPLAQARAAKKQGGSISRDELLDLIWAHALRNGGIKPPLVKL